MKYFSILLMALLAGCETTGVSRHERHVQAVEASAVQSPVPGGESFTSSKPYDVLFDEILTALKKRDYVIESANRETGQITTGLVITGGWRQTGTRSQVMLIKEPTGVTVKAAVSEQQRYKAIQVEPWGEAKANKEKSVKFASDLKETLSS